MLEKQQQKFYARNFQKKKQTKKIKNRSNFLDKHLILHCLFKKKVYRVWSRHKGTVCLILPRFDFICLNKYFQKDKNQFSQCTVQLI